jgi:hypothetical protein
MAPLPESASARRSADPDYLPEFPVNARWRRFSGRDILVEFPATIAAAAHTS